VGHVPSDLALGMAPIFDRAASMNINIEAFITGGGNKWNLPACMSFYGPPEGDGKELVERHFRACVSLHPRPLRDRVVVGCWGRLCCEEASGRASRPPPRASPPCPYARHMLRGVQRWKSCESFTLGLRVGEQLTRPFRDARPIPPTRL
jgi:hypothetical protein